MKWPGQSRPQSILGLVLEDKFLRVALVDLGATGEAGPPSVSLAFDLERSPPEELARDLRAALTGLRSRERRCVVGLPAEWTVAVAGAVPELSPADLESLLALEAEKGFPCDPVDLQIVRSHQRIGVHHHVTQYGIQTERILRLESVLRTAGLRPASFTLTLAALVPAPLPLEAGHLTVLLGPSAVSVAYAAGGGLVQIRALGAGLEDGSSIIRELRITLEEISAELRSALSTVTLVGPEQSTRSLSSTLAPLSGFAPLTLGSRPLTPEAVPAILAQRWLRREMDLPEFLPPRPSRWKQWLRHTNTRRLGTAAAAAAAGILALVGLFGWQEYRAWSLRHEWAQMKADVEALTAVQERIREYRPWHDTSFATLSTLKLVTEVFPETGAVTAKSIEIKGHSLVTLTGSTRENASLLESLDRLRQRPEVSNLKIDQIRGKSPAQFTFTFQLSRTPRT